MHPNSPVETIKSRLSIVDAVSPYVKLEKSGANYKARCPFHNEKTPSFYVSPSRNTYHCFGCNRGGDIFTFVEEIEGLDFSGALKLLAEKAGVALSGYSPSEAKEAERLYRILEEAAAFYEEELAKSAPAREYLRKRGLSEETIAEFRVGYCRPEWRSLLFRLRDKGYRDEEIEKAGLAIKGSKGYFDRFRGRVMFPLADAQGRIVGFSGRVFDNADDPKNAKYVNSPETVLYKKSKILFGYDKAKRAMAEKDFCLLVEGQVDLLMAHQAGTRNTVAVSGTALTEDHLLLIKRFTDSLVLAFDADEAGLKAARRGFELALSLGMDVKIIELPDGKDPADYIHAHGGGWEGVLAGARPIIEFLLERLARQRLDERTMRREVQKELVPLVAKIPNRLDQAYFIKAIAAATGIIEDDLREVVFRSAEAPAEEPPPAPPPPASSLRPLRRLVAIAAWKEPESASLKERLQEVTGKSFEDAVASLSMPKEKLAFEAEMHYQGHPALQAEIEDLLVSLQTVILEEQLQGYLHELRLAEQSGEGKAAEALLKQCNDVSRRIHDLKKRRHSNQ